MQTQIKTKKKTNKKDKDISYVSNLKNWKTVSGFINSNSQFNESQIRWLLRFRESNGLKDAVRLVGRNLYINEALFSKWLIKKEF